MKSQSAFHRLSLRAVCHTVGVLMLPLFFTQCETTGYKYSKVEYTPEKLATPPGHGMTKSDYPFDDDGQYRRDWVKNNTKGRTRSSYPGSSSQASSQPAQEAESNYQGTADYQEVPISQDVQSETQVASQSVQYHHVASGDTLYSISQRYGANVEDLKRINGLSGNTIISGQTLRIP